MIQPDPLQSNERLIWSTGTGTDVWAIFCACVAGDLDAVKRLVEMDPSLVRAQHCYRTPLYFAVRENRQSVVEFLLEHRANAVDIAFGTNALDICRDRGYAELGAWYENYLEKHVNVSSKGDAVAAAIRAHDAPAMRRLLDAQPELLHFGDMRSNQPIHWATMTRQLDFIDELIERGADVNAVRYDGARPIHLANGDYWFRGWRDVPKDWPTKPREVIDHLRSRGAYCDICTACHIGDIERIHVLLAEDASLANRVSDCKTCYPCSGTPLRNAAGRGRIDIVRLLLEHGADPNLPEEGCAPHGHALYAAVESGHFEVAKLLLEHGANPNQEVESSADALSRAISNDDQPMIELLSSYGASRPAELLGYDGDVRTAAAAFAANPELANDPDALANAAWEGKEAFVRLMLRYKPDLPKLVTFPGWSVCAKTRELNELLFEHGMNPSQPDWLHATPLHHMARKGDVENAEHFIDRGADLDAREEDFCSTPLGWAAKHGQLNMVELLLRRGAKPNLPDDPPWATPLAWATRNGHHEIAEMLKRHGADR